MASAAELSVLDKAGALLDALYDALRVRLDEDMRCRTSLPLNSAMRTRDGRLNLRTQYLAESLCTKLADPMLRLRPQSQARGPHRVAFLGTTGTGKSFVLDCLLLLLCVGGDEYGQQAFARVQEQLRERELLAQGELQSPGAAEDEDGTLHSPAPGGAPLAGAPSAASQQAEEEEAPEAPGSPVRGAAAPQLDAATAPVSWAAEVRALAAFMSRAAWATAGDRDAHMKAAAWDAHSFVLRLSGGGTGTAKFLELADAPRFGAELTLRNPRALVQNLRDFDKLQTIYVSNTRTLRPEEDARRRLLLEVWRVLSGAAGGAEPGLADLPALQKFAYSFGRPVGYRNHLKRSWKAALPEPLYDAMNRSELDPLFCKVLLQPHGGGGMPEREAERVRVRDTLSSLLDPERGLGCLVERARLELPLGRCGLRHVLLTDVAGTTDASAAHAADTRAAVAETDLAVVILEVDDNGRPKVDAQLAASLRSSPFIRRMLLAAPHEQTCSLVLVVNADKCDPPLEERKEDVDALRKKIGSSVLTVCAEALMREGACVAAVTLNHAAAAAAAAGAHPDEDASDTEGYAPAPAVGLTKEEAKARIAAILANLPVVYLRPHTAAAAVLAAANPELLSRYCAAPARYGATAQPLQAQPPPDRGQLEGVLCAAGVPRLLELISAVRAPEAAALAKVLEELEGHLVAAVAEIERHTISLPAPVYEIFRKWSDYVSKMPQVGGRGRQRTPATRKVPPPVSYARLKEAVTGVLDAVFWAKQQARNKRGWQTRSAKMREQLAVHMRTRNDWLNPRKLYDTSRTFSIRQLVMPALNDVKPVADKLVEALIAAAAELLQREHEAMWAMYDMPNQSFVKLFAGAPYSAGAAGDSERGALELLKSTHLAEVDYLLGSTLLARVVNCSMWPRAQRQARSEEEAGAGSAAEEEETEEDEEESAAAAAPEAVGLAALYGKGLRRAVEAVLEQHCNAAVDHLVEVDLRSALKRAAAAAAAANVDEEQAALEECREGVVTHAVQLFTQLVRGPGFGGRKLDADLKLLAKQFRDCVKANIAAAKAEILASWQASLSAFGNASAPVQEAAPEPKDAGLSARLEAQLRQVRELRSKLRDAAGNNAPAGAQAGPHEYGLKCITALEMLSPSRLPALAALAAAQQQQQPLPPLPPLSPLSPLPPLPQAAAGLPLHLHPGLAAAAGADVAEPLRKKQKRAAVATVTEDSSEDTMECVLQPGASTTLRVSCAAGSAELVIPAGAVTQPTRVCLAARAVCDDAVDLVGPLITLLPHGQQLLREAMLHITIPGLAEDDSVVLVSNPGVGDDVRWSPCDAADYTRVSSEQLHCRIRHFSHMGPVAALFAQLRITYPKTIEQGRLCCVDVEVFLDTKTHPPVYEGQPQYLLRELPEGSEYRISLSLKFDSHPRVDVATSFMVPRLHALTRRPPDFFYNTRLTMQPPPVALDGGSVSGILSVVTEGTRRKAASTWWRRRGGEAVDGPFTEHFSDEVTLSPAASLAHAASATALQPWSSLSSSVLSLPKRWDYFISHYQLNAQLQARALHGALAARGKRAWLDQDEVPNVPGVIEGVTGSACFIMLLTRGALRRDFCLVELRKAIELGKPIILLRETNATLPKHVVPVEHGGDGTTLVDPCASLAELRAEAPADLQHMFDACVVRPHTSREHYDALVNEICDATYAVVVPPAEAAPAAPPLLSESDGLLAVLALP